jgi:PTS hybrid protein
VEGTVAAAVAAQSSATLAEVVHAAEDASAVPGLTAPEHPTPPTVVGDVDVMGSMKVATAESTQPPTVRVTLTNDIGLHARPAAMIARALTPLNARVTISFRETTADGRSVLALMALGAQGGDEVTVSATGPQAEEALAAVESLAARNFTD